MAETERFTVKTIWKNQFQYGAQAGQDYWTLVLEDGSRLPCYDSAVMEAIGVDLDERRTDFDPPEEFEFDYEIRKDKTVLVGVAESNGKKKSTKKGTKAKPIKVAPKQSTAPAARTPATSKPFYNRSFNRGKPKEENTQILRLSVLKTSVEFIGYQKVRTMKALEDAVKHLQTYAETGEFKKEK
jgi:hypothetical protein